MNTRGRGGSSWHPGARGGMLRLMKKTIAAFLSALALSLLTACGGGGASAAGTYTVDKAELKQAMMAAMPASAKGNPAAEGNLDKVLEGMEIALDLKADGTASFNVKMAMMNVDTTEKGTWKLDGSKLTLVTTNAAGTEDTKTADYANGTFAIEDDVGGQKMKMTFKKKAK
ncbi:MAG TPA: hypothetical protein VF384_17830 [Planctomycetota bacterium]